MTVFITKVRPKRKNQKQQSQYFLSLSLLSILSFNEFGIPKVYNDVLP